MKVTGKKIFFFVGISTLVVASFQNCSGVSFDNTPPAAKAQSTPNPNPNPNPNPSPNPNPQPQPQPGVNVFGCPLNPPIPTQFCKKFLTASLGNTWKVPCDFNTNLNTLEAIGNGSDGSGDTRGGGGGGAYSKSTNIGLIPGSTVAFHTEHTTLYFPGPSTDGHTTAVNSGDSWLCNGTANCASMKGSAVVVGAAGGKGMINTTPLAPYSPYYHWIDAVGGVGGQASEGIALGTGALKYSGGNGGNCENLNCATVTMPGSGGGAAGPHGNGLNGGSSSASGGAGDAGYGGKGGTTEGGAGGVGTEWDTLHGSGGGGGGSKAVGSYNGGAGGNYGGGGGSAGPQMLPSGQYIGLNAGGRGGDGLIVISYFGSSCQ